MLSETFVFVPSYNHAPFIEECLRSVISQTARPNKLLVIDDGSTDDSPSIIEKVLADCPFEAELIVRENRGLCHTLNEGFAASTGKYFAYLGSDDLWLPRFLESRSTMLDARPEAVLAFGNAWLVDIHGRRYDSTANYDEDWASYPDGDPRPMLVNGVAPISSTVVYRRSALKELRWNEDARLEDYEMYLKLMGRGDFAFDANVLSAWRQHGYNTSNDQRMMLDELMAAQTRNADLLGVNGLNKAHMRTKFRFARIALQQGRKRDALRLLSESWRFASPVQLSKFALRMLLPNFILERHRQTRAA